MGQSANRGGLFLYEVLLPLQQSRTQALSGCAGENRGERQPGYVLGTGEIRRQIENAQDGYEPRALQNQYGRGTRRRLRALRLPSRDRSGLRFSSFATRYFGIMYARQRAHDAHSIFLSSRHLGRSNAAPPARTITARVTKSAQA